MKWTKKTCYKYEKNWNWFFAKYCDVESCKNIRKLLAFMWKFDKMVDFKNLLWKFWKFSAFLFFAFITKKLCDWNFPRNLLDLMENLCSFEFSNFLNNLFHPTNFCFYFSQISGQLYGRRNPRHDGQEEEHSKYVRHSPRRSWKIYIDRFTGE